MHEGVRLFSSLVFAQIRERYIEATTSEVTFVLVVKAFQHQETQLSPSQEHAARTEVAYNLLDSLNHLTAFFQLCKALLTRIHSPSTTKQC